MAEIKVGAIVNYRGRQGKLRGVITRFDSKSGFYNVLWEDGYTSLLDNEGTTSVLLTDETYNIENTLNAIKEKHEPKIKIGMIVKNNFLCKGVVTAICGDDIHILWYNGETTIEDTWYVINHRTEERSESLNELFSEMM